MGLRSLALTSKSLRLLVRRKATRGVARQNNRPNRPDNQVQVFHCLNIDTLLPNNSNRVQRTENGKMFLRDQIISIAFVAICYLRKMPYNGTRTYHSIRV